VTIAREGGFLARPLYRDLEVFMRIGCLLTFVISLAPRLVLLLLWLFTARVSQAFGGLVLPLLGFLFLPFTTTAYVLVWTPGDGVSGAAWLLVIGGLLVDLVTYAVSRYVGRPKVNINS